MFALARALLHNTTSPSPALPLCSLRKLHLLPLPLASAPRNTSDHSAFSLGAPCPNRSVIFPSPMLICRLTNDASSFESDLRLAPSARLDSTPSWRARCTHLVRGRHAHSPPLPPLPPPLPSPLPPPVPFTPPLRRRPPPTTPQRSGASRFARWRTPPPTA